MGVAGGMYGKTREGQWGSGLDTVGMNMENRAGGLVIGPGLVEIVAAAVEDGATPGEHDTICSS